MSAAHRLVTGLVFVALYGLYASGRYVAPGLSPVIELAALVAIAGLFVWVFLRADEVQRRLVLEASTLAFLVTALAIVAPTALTAGLGAKGLWAIACGSWLAGYAWRWLRVGL